LQRDYGSEKKLYGAQRREYCGWETSVSVNGGRLLHDDGAPHPASRGNGIDLLEVIFNERHEKCGAAIRCFHGNCDDEGADDHDDDDNDHLDVHTNDEEVRLFSWKTNLLAGKWPRVLFDPPISPMGLPRLFLTGTCTNIHNAFVSLHILLNGLAT